MDPAAEGEQVGDAVPPEPTLTVSAVARRMGVAPPTLRTWDRRYGLGPSGHTAGAHRRYTSGDVARLLVMRRLTLEGVSPADAARIAKATPVQGDDSAFPLPVRGWDLGDPAGSSGDNGPDSGSIPAPLSIDGPDYGTPAWTDDAGDDPGYAESDLINAQEQMDSHLFGLREVVGRGSAGGGRVVAMPYGTPQSRGLARAAMSLDTYEITRLIRDSLRRDGTVSTWTSMIMPVLGALGERTQANGDVIDVEHAFSESVLGALRSVLLDSPHQGRNTSTVLLACADGDYHSLPLHALAAALAERKVSSRMLGSGLPPNALSASVRRTGPSVVVLFARMPGADATATQILRRQRPAPTVVLAGPGWLPETIPPFARSAASLDEAIGEVMQGVHL